MSLCRWSTDNFRCDLYVYYSASGGIDINVAANRIMGPYTDDPIFLLMFQEERPSNEEFTAARELHDRTFDSCPRMPIGGPLDGALLNATDEIEAIEILLDLRAKGYNFPDDVILELREQMPKEIAYTLPDGLDNG